MLGTPPRDVVHSRGDAGHSLRDVAHRMRCIVRASDAVAAIGCAPLRTMASTPGPVVRPSRTSGAVVRTAGSGGAHRGAVGARTGPCGRADRCAHHGLGGARHGACGAFRTARGVLRRGSGSSEVPLSHTPLTSVPSKSHMHVMHVPSVWQITRTGREGGFGGRASVGRSSNAHRLGQAVRWVRAPRMWCAHQDPPVRAPSPPRAHRGAVAGGCAAPRCAPVRPPGVDDIAVRAPVRTMPRIVAIRCAPAGWVRTGCPTLPHRPMLTEVESTSTRWTSGWAPPHSVAPLSTRWIGPPGL